MPREGREGEGKRCFQVTIQHRGNPRGSNYSPGVVPAGTSKAWGCAPCPPLPPSWLGPGAALTR